jgi:hypothetical protein
MELCTRLRPAGATSSGGPPHNCGRPPRARPYRLLLIRSRRGGPCRGVTVVLVDARRSHIPQPGIGSRDLLRNKLTCFKLVRVKLTPIKFHCAESVELQAKAGDDAKVGSFLGASPQHLARATGLAAKGDS